MACRSSFDQQHPAVSSGAVSQLGMSGLVRAVGAAINLAASLYAVPQDAAIAVCALRRERMHRAFETVEHMRFPVFCHSKCWKPSQVPVKKSAQGFLQAVQEKS